MSEPKQPDKRIDLLDRLAPHIQKVGFGTLKDDRLFQFTVRAAIVKAYEFTVYAHKNHAEPFFLTPTLRGLCDDLIALSFLAPLGDRDDVVQALHEHNMYEAMISQKQFLKASRSWQPVPEIDDLPGRWQSSKDELRAIAKAHKWAKALPTVKDMATSCGLLTLYDFMYSATSKWVHFSPHVLLRMGWAKAGVEKQFSPETQWELSTSHFAVYYNEFNRIYSVLILTRLAMSFLSEFDQRDEVQQILQLMEEANKETLRWPELVTFEELNMDDPGWFIRIRLRAHAARMEDVDTSVELETESDSDGS